jgi:ferredoxin
VSATLALGLLLVVPFFTTRRGVAAPPPSVVDEDVCVGCVQCSLDCPYGAIEMIPRVSVRSAIVARVNPDLCVSCGICSGSCAPMGVGPAGRTGRDQVARAQAFAAADARRSGEVVVVTCEHGASSFASALAARGGVIYPVRCAGNLHTSVIEMIVRGGAGGVLVLACPPRDCWNREGPRWLSERVYHGREAELQARVDRARVRIAYANAAETALAVAALEAFARQVAALGVPPTDKGPAPEPVCDPGDVEVRS